MSKRITVVSPQGESFEIDNTKENLEKAVSANYTVNKSLLDDIKDIGSDIIHTNVGYVPAIKNEIRKNFSIDYAPSQLEPKEKQSIGMLEPGNIDLQNRPVAKNKDGSISTVRSMGVNIDGKEVLIPTVSDDGKILSDGAAIDQYKKTGKHLGIFSDSNSSEEYAKRLHQEQEKLYSKKEEYDPKTDPNAQGLQGQTETAARGFQNQVAGGILEPIVSKFAPNEIDKTEKLNKENPISGIAGNVVGAASNLALTMTPVGAAGRAAESAVLGTELGADLATKQIESGIVKKIIGSTAKYAAEGALYSTPQAVVQASYGDPEQAAETMLWGVGLSGVLGAGVKTTSIGAKALISKAAPLIESATSKLSSNIENKIAKNTDKLESLLSDPELKNAISSPIDSATKFQIELFHSIPDTNNLSKENIKFIEEIHSKIAEGGSDPSFKKLEDIKSVLYSMKKKYIEDEAKTSIIDLASTILQKDIDEGSNKIYSSGKLSEPFVDFIADKAGKAAGGAVGAYAGQETDIPGASAVGGFAGYHGGGFVLRKLLNNSGLGIKGSSFLRKALLNPETEQYIGGLMAKSGKDALTDHIEKIPSYISGSSSVSKSLVAANPFSHILGDSSGLSKEQQYNKLTYSIQQASTDVNLTAEKVGHIASAFSGTDVNLSNLVTQKKLAAIAYLDSQIPKNPNQPSAFQKDDWKPTKQEQGDFLHKVSIVNDPMVVWAHYQDKTLDTIDRDTLKAVYPKIYQQMVDKIVLTAYDPRTPKLNHNDRMQLSMFTGIPLDESLKNIAAIQQSLSSQQTQPQQPKSTGRASAHPKLKMPSLATSTQKREERLK